MTSITANDLLTRLRAERRGEIEPKGELSPMLLRVFTYMAHHIGERMSVSELAKISGTRSDPSEVHVRWMMNQLRHALPPKIEILSIRGVGYQMARRS